MRRSCSSCGAEVTADGRFCHSCGASLWTTCPACGAEQAVEAAFCSSCGAALQSGVRRAGDLPEHEERRVVTVLFADLAGSTALGERIEPEDVRALQGELFDLVNAEVERFGGVSEKFVGDAVASLKVADGLLARLDGRTDEARGLLMEGADELDRLGRHYDAACVALEAAVAADANGEAEIASDMRTRAAALLDPLGCVNPF